MPSTFRILFPFVTLFELVGVLCEWDRILEYFVYYRMHRNNYQFSDKDVWKIKYQINVVSILQNHDYLKKNQHKINIILPLQKPHSFTISIWYGANMYIPHKIPNSWKCENPMLIWYLFNKCGWLGIVLHYVKMEHIQINKPYILMNHTDKWVLHTYESYRLMSPTYLWVVQTYESKRLMSRRDLWVVETYES